MKKKLIFAFIMVAAIVLSYMPIVKAEEGQKETWIDNTVDNSTTDVIGILKVKNLKTEEISEIKVYDEVTSSTYSTYSNPTVLQMIEEAKTAVVNKAKEYKGDFDSETLVETESTGEVWDHRKYETIESQDAALIGDTSYMPSAVGGETTKTHIATGEYGKRHFYTVEGYVEISGEEELKVTEGDNQTYYKGSNQDLIIKTNGELSKLQGVEIDNGNPLRDEDRELSKGSTILKLKAAFLEKTSLGVHTITFKYEDGEVEAKFTVAEEEEEPTYKVVYDFNGGKDKKGQKKVETKQVAYVPMISKENFIDEFGVTPPKGKEFDAIEVNGKRYEIGDGYELNKDTVFKYLWKSDGSNTGDVTNPQTGDNIMLYVAILGISIIALSGTIVYFKKFN